MHHLSEIGLCSSSCTGAVLIERRIIIGTSMVLTLQGLFNLEVCSMQINLNPSA